MNALIQVWRDYEPRTLPVIVINFILPGEYFDINLSTDKRQILFVRVVIGNGCKCRKTFSLRRFKRSFARLSMRATQTCRSLRFRLDPSEVKWERVALRTQKSSLTLPMRSLSFRKAKNRRLQSKTIHQAIFLLLLLHHHLLLLLPVICFLESRRSFLEANGSKKNQHLSLLKGKGNGWKSYRFNPNRSCFPLQRLTLRSQSSSIAVRNQKSGGIPNSLPPNPFYRSNHLLRLPPNRLPKPHRILL